MRCVIAYVTVTNGPLTDTFAARLAATYREFPPGADHSTLVVCNGGPAAHSTGVILGDLPDCHFLPRLNDGWDLGAYVSVSNGITSDFDMMLCLGQSVFFHRAGWLSRLVQAWKTYGPGMYGFFSSHSPRAHLQTTAFATSPELLRQHPWRVSTKTERYEFEHGHRSFWRTLALAGKSSILVTWDGLWNSKQWRQPPNILWRGDQSNCLLFCNHTEHYVEATPKTRQSWARWADQPFS